MVGVPINTPMSFFFCPRIGLSLLRPKDTSNWCSALVVWWVVRLDQGVCPFRLNKKRGFEFQTIQASDVQFGGETMITEGVGIWGDSLGAISHIKLSQGAFRGNPPGSLLPPVSLQVGFPETNNSIAPGHVCHGLQVVAKALVRAVVRAHRGLRRTSEGDMLPEPTRDPPYTTPEADQPQTCPNLQPSPTSPLP